MKFTKHTKEFIEQYVDMICEFLLINNPLEIIYNIDEYSHIQLNIDDEDLTSSTLWIGSKLEDYIELCFAVAHELRHAYQFDVVNDAELIKNSDDDKYILDYVQQVNNSFKLQTTNDIKPELEGYNKLFTELDADAFGVVLVNEMFNIQKGKILVPKALRSGGNYTDSDIKKLIGQANTIIVSEEMSLFPFAKMKKLMEKYQVK